MTRKLLSLGITLLCPTAPAFAGVTVATPEPTTMLLIGGGLGAILVVRHATTKKK